MTEPDTYGFCHCRHGILHGFIAEGVRLGGFRLLSSKRGAPSAYRDERGDLPEYAYVLRERRKTPDFMGLPIPTKRLQAHGLWWLGWDSYELLRCIILLPCSGDKPKEPRIRCCAGEAAQVHLPRLYFLHGPLPLQKNETYYYVRPEDVFMRALRRWLVDPKKPPGEPPTRPAVTLYANEDDYLLIEPFAHGDPGPGRYTGFYGRSLRELTPE